MDDESSFTEDIEDVKLKVRSVNKIHLMSFHYPNFAIEDKPYK